MQQQQRPDSELFVVCTDCIVLECRCGGRLSLLGHEEDWYAEGRTTFGCHQCEERLTLADQSGERRGADLIGESEAEMSVRDLIRNLRASEGR